MSRELHQGTTSKFNLPSKNAEGDLLAFTAARKKEILEVRLLCLGFASRYLGEIANTFLDILTAPKLRNPLHV